MWVRKPRSQPSSRRTPATGSAYWNEVINFEALCEEGTISPRDLELFQWCETAEDAWKHIAAFYKIRD